MRNDVSTNLFVLQNITQHGDPPLSFMYTRVHFSGKISRSWIYYLSLLNFRHVLKVGIVCVSVMCMRGGVIV